MSLGDLDPEHGLAVFTDGSANYRDRSGGWAWVALDALEGIFCASGYIGDTTISRMELYAPTNALERIADVFGPTDVLVYSDSEYVVLGNTVKTRKRYTNHEWWDALDKAIALHNEIEWIHVRGHSDNLYNEMADQLAGKARKESCDN